MLGFLARPTARNAINPLERALSTTLAFYEPSLPVYKVRLPVVTARRLAVVLLVLGLRVLRRTVTLRWLLGVLSWIIALMWLLILVSDTIDGPRIITLLS